jgi:hypothetical protein
VECFARLAAPKVHTGRIELLEELSLPEGTEVVVTPTAAEASPEPSGIVDLETWDLGPMRPLTRAQI